MCSYPNCMQLWGGCGVGCTEAIAARSSRKRRKAVAGMKVVSDKAVPVGTIEFHHPDGRIDRFKITQ